ncbi:MAG: Na+/H+ antiporter subunit E [Prolixibacteraceae bacterium]|jgi:multicomponent Na+:H+ antiporter subunit E|nr:Na+/H+ antiporter subunit E [Prolixibacteraceae bacterium]
MIKLLKWVFSFGALATAVAVLWGAVPDRTIFIFLSFIGFSFLGWLSSAFYNRKAFFQVILLFELVLYFIWEMIKASVIVAIEVITPKHYMEAGLVAVPLDTESDLELTIFSSLVSLTPGTLSLDVSVDKTVLYVHAMYIPNADAGVLVTQLKNGFEKRVINIFRP